MRRRLPQGARSAPPRRPGTGLRRAALQSSRGGEELYIHADAGIDDIGGELVPALDASEFGRQPHLRRLDVVQRHVAGAVSLYGTEPSHAAKARASKDVRHVLVVVPGIPGILALGRNVDGYQHDVAWIAHWRPHAAVISIS